ncbi:Alpha/Beta hydrolase protein [Chytriomyces sp. MP71]|nr:Alpha/Beta hydrolase protein [Chytriomyces sp. MP71]
MLVFVSFLLPLLVTSSRHDGNERLELGMRLETVMRASSEAGPRVGLEMLSMETLQALNQRDPFPVAVRTGSVPQWSLHSSSQVSRGGGTNGTRPASSNSFSLGHKDVLLPDHTDPATVLSLGLMAYNAYYEPQSSDWLPVPGWEPSHGFGGSKSAIRGHIYKSDHHDVVVIVIKGTSLQQPFTGGQTATNDKLNDNKMFSCCCGKAGWSWRAVAGCDCANSAATECKSQCVSEASDYPESYYRLATTITDAARDMFPFSTIWMTGHSLGGSLASLVALTFDYPAFTFETPGDLLFAKRIGLLPPAPPSFHEPRAMTRENPTSKRLFSLSYPTQPPGPGGGDADNWDAFLESLEIYQFGNNGDPAYLGTCTASIYSSCWLGGYAIETKCHLGKECVYDLDKDGQSRPSLSSTLARLSLQEEGAEGLKEMPLMPKREVLPRERDAVTRLAKESINNHGIKFVVENLLSKWKYVPECRVNYLNEKCVDCETWSWLP